ncbi:MAG: four helix bundle protein [Cytophagales bacterium]|nr:MAG: four helix bundle protein [Cytophagales bacterium]
MPTVHRFEELICWQKARLLDNKIYKFSCKPIFKQDFSLTDQIRRASGSVMDNIAEDFERDGKREFINFLSIAKGSVGEVRSQCYRANDRDYISENEFREIYTLSLDVARRIGNLMTYLRTSDLKGVKYKLAETEPEYKTSRSEKSFADIPEEHVGLFINEHYPINAEGTETIETALANETTETA